MKYKCTSICACTMVEPQFKVPEGTNLIVSKIVPNGISTVVEVFLK